ncbi:MAG: hypothetical protein AB8E82_11675 [Aureispira sp.]
MKVILFLLLAMITDKINAQSKVSVLGGWTASKIRTLYDKNINKGPAFSEASDMPILHAPYLGFEYEYDYKKLHLSTGIALLTLGSNKTPFFGEIPWPTYYWAFPLLGGYNIFLSKKWNLIVEGGTEICFQQGSSGLIGTGSYWGNINAVLGVELCYKRFRLGMRGHWGVTDFRYLDPITYQHTAITTYLSYDLWDHAKAKARRLRKQQEQLLD